jgi:hypothetical protein
VATLASTRFEAVVTQLGLELGKALVMGSRSLGRNHRPDRRAERLGGTVQPGR